MNRPSFFRVAFKQFWLLFGAIWFFVGGIFAIVGGGMLWYEWRFGQQGVDAQARVIEKYTRSGSKGGTTYHLSYEFTTADGFQISSRDQVDEDVWERVAEGSTVAIKYLPHPPYQSRIPGSSRWLLPGIFGGVGLVFGGIGGVLFFRSLFRVRTILRVVREGVQVQGTVAELRETNMSINRVRQWCIRYRFTDFAGRLHEADSDYMSPAEAHEWKEGDTGMVRYDQNQPEVSYWLGRES